MAKSNQNPKTKQTNVNEWQRQLAEKDAEIALLKEHIQTTAGAAAKTWHGLHNRLSLEALEAILVKCKEVQLEISDNTGDSLNLTPMQRRRLRGAGMYRYGFIDKLSDIITNTKYNTHDIKDCLRLLETVRNISVRLETALRTTNDIQLTLGNDAYRMALIMYRQLQIDSREGDPVAQTLFEILRKFFRPWGKRSGAEPTEAEVERDVRALLHGKKDGKIIVENERPHLAGGKHLVIDKTDK